MKYDWTHENELKIVHCEIYNLENLISKIELIEDDYKSDSILENRSLIKLGENDARILIKHYYLELIPISLDLVAPSRWWNEVVHILEMKLDYYYSDEIRITPLNVKHSKNYRFLNVFLNLNVIHSLYSYLIKANKIDEYKDKPSLYNNFKIFCTWIEEEMPYGYQLIGD